MTDPTPNRPPLWQAMHDAYWQAAGCEPLPPPPVAPECAAAEIRAIAKEVRQVAKLWSSEEVADWLDMEADRAEAGGMSNTNRPPQHDLAPCELLALDWRPALDIKMLRSNDEYSELCGYHEAHFSIGADEVGRILITDTALQALRDGND